MRKRYFEWLLHFITSFDDQYYGKYYQKLMKQLHEIEFIWDKNIDLDEDRATYGMDLRREFADIEGIRLGENLEPLDGPCSVLEMMIALAIGCENEDPMSDEEETRLNRTGTWFWNMVKNLGLYNNDDYNYSRELTKKNIDIFLYREYKRNGKGGLFTVSKQHRDKDMREIDIWWQAMLYYDEISYDDSWLDD